MQERRIISVDLIDESKIPDSATSTINVNDSFNVAYVPIYAASSNNQNAINIKWSSGEITCQVMPYGFYIPLKYNSGSSYKPYFGVWSSGSFMYGTMKYGGNWQDGMQCFFSPTIKYSSAAMSVYSMNNAEYYGIQRNTIYGYVKLIFSDIVYVESKNLNYQNTMTIYIDTE